MQNASGVFSLASHRSFDKLTTTLFPKATSYQHALPSSTDTNVRTTTTMLHHCCSGSFTVRHFQRALARAVKIIAHDDIQNGTTTLPLNPYARAHEPADLSVFLRENFWPFAKKTQFNWNERGRRLWWWWWFCTHTQSSNIAAITLSSSAPNRSLIGSFGRVACARVSCIYRLSWRRQFVGVGAGLW